MPATKLIIRGSEAIALSAVFEDAATELKIIYNLLQLRSRDQSSKDYTDHFFTTHMNRILTKYSTRRDSAANVRPNQSNNNAIKPPKELSISEDDYNSNLITILISLIKMFLKLSDEVVDSGTCTWLEEYVGSERQMLKSIEKLVQRGRQSVIRIRNLQEELERCKLDTRQMMIESEKALAILKDQYQEAKAKSAMEYRYLSKFYNAETEQMENHFRAEEEALAEQIRTTQAKIEQETRAAEETRGFFFNRLENLNQQNTYWKEKMKEKTEDLRGRLKALNRRREETRKTFEELSRQYEEYEAVVLADRAVKAKARRIEELQVKQEECAQIIQNWWRYQLVQKSLGPFAKKKKKKGKKGGGGGKKKK